MRKVAAVASTRPAEFYRLPNGYAVKGLYHSDRKSPDGKRFEAANAKEFKKVAEFVAASASGNCEKCKQPHFIGKFGHPHHVRHSKMGAGFRDDRYSVRGERQLFWVCAAWHEAHHGGKA